MMRVRELRLRVTVKARRRTLVSRVAIPAVAFALVACASEPATAPAVPTSLTQAQASLTGTVGKLLTVAPTVALKDASGAFVGGVALTVAITAGGGTITAAPARSANGPTAIGQWTLGTLAGVNTITVTAGTLPPLLVSVTGTADVPTQVVIVSGAGQSAPANSTLPQPVVARVNDRFGNGVPNIPTTFIITLGGGTLGPGAAQNTAADGAVTSPDWTLGRTASPQRLTLTAGALSGSAEAAVATAFVPDVRFFGPTVESTIQQSFIRAAQRVGGMITGDVPDVTLASFDVASTCGATGVPPMSEAVDDVVIFATVVAIDGVGRVLGSAGPCIIRNQALGRFTVIGVMRFDVADMQTLASDGRLDAVILHEMLHVLGFGTLWSLKGLALDPGTPTTAFSGVQAQQGCFAAGGTTTCAASVPVENTGGSGTADGHWRETVFRTELMTGFVSGVGVPNPLSLVTIGSMADLGYTVNSNVDDAYTLASAVAADLQLVREAGGASQAFVEELLRPRAEVTRGGRMTILPERR